MSTLKNMFGIKDEFAVVTENPDALKSQSNTIRLVKDKRVKVPGSISIYDKDVLVQETKLTTYATLQEAYWTRLTVRDHEINRAGQETRISQVFGGSFKPTKIKVEVEINNEIISLQELITQIIIESSNGKSRDDVMKILDETNILKGLNDGMPLFFQQMGASQNGMQHAAEIFKAAGAIDDIGSLKGNARFHACYDMKDKQGLEVLSFELGSSDRSQSKTRQGFVDLVDAVVSNLMRVLAQKTTAAILTHKLEETIANLSQAEVKGYQSKIKSQLDMAKQYPVCWSGASQQKSITSSNDIVTADKYNATNAPSGRWTVVGANGPVDLDVWSNSTKSPSQPIASSADIDTSVAPF